MESIQGRSLKTTWILAAGMALSGMAMATADDYNYKDPGDFKSLDTFASVSAFEDSVGAYEQDCLDHTGGGSGGVPCSIMPSVWDKETEANAASLDEKLPGSSKAAFQVLQETWDGSQEKAIALNSSLLDRIHDERGTMFQLMRSQDAGAQFAPLSKSRALLTRNFLRAASGKGFLKDGLDIPTKSLAALDKDLNVEYQELRSKLNAERIALLKESEKAWIKSRDAMSAFVSTLGNKDLAEKALKIYIAERTGLLSSWRGMATQTPDSEDDLYGSGKGE